MNKQEFAQQLALKVISNNPTHHTNESFTVSILNAVKQCIKVANIIDAEAPEFFGETKYVPVELPEPSKGVPRV